jgi:fructokinase
VSSARQEVLGGVEAGGTKFVCVTGTADGTILSRERFDTRDPQSTVAEMRDFFARLISDGQQLAAIGVAAFGPLELRRAHAEFGHIGVTPKAGWSHTDLVGPLAQFGVPVVIDTDVNGAALGEGTWGAATGLDQFVYLTVGTGIGGGVVAGGVTVQGLVHPEIGHISVGRLAGDDFAGVCPFHGDCFEGMASGPAIAARWGRPAEDLSGDDLVRAVDVEAAYLAAGIRNVVYTVAPQRIVIGGGVRNLPGLFPAVRRHLADQLNGYPGLAEHGADDFVVAAGCGDDAGTMGALALAASAEGK